jgi:hypothetical protein
MPTAITISQ